MASWNSFAPEIRNQILDQVFRTSATCRNLAACAAVSREWQTYIEPRNFRRLVLGHSCVADFGQIMHSRKSMVQHIWLRIELPKYHCSTCNRPETPQQKQKNNRIFTKALFQLLRILGSWEDKKSRRGPVDSNRPVLELSIHSPSDMKHRFDVFAMDKDVYPHKFDENCTYEEFDDYVERKLRKDFTRGQLCTVATGSRTNVEHLRMFAEIELDFSAIGYFTELPHNDYIKALIVRRQYYRNFNPGTVAEIVRSFHRIGSLTFEPITRDPDPFSTAFKQGYKKLILEAYRFKSFSIFQGYYGRQVLRRPWRKLPTSFSLTLADESQHLEHLSVAFAGDAMAFFQDFLQPDSEKYRLYLDPSRLAVQNALLQSLPTTEHQQIYSLPRGEKFQQALLKAAGFEHGRIPRSVYKPQWLKLKTLALASHFVQTHDLFEAAGFAAMEMPELQTMEIWDDQGFDVVEFFRYSRHEKSRDGSPAITWVSNFGAPPEQQVITAWGRVAMMHTNQRIQVLVPTLSDDDELPGHPYNALGYLELRDKIVHPMSLHEFQWYYDEWTRPVERLGVENTREFNP